MPEREWQRVDEDTLARITGYCKQYKWVAEVTVPTCDELVSQERAELVVQAALDLLKVFFGSSYGKGIRLASAGGLLDTTADLTRDEDGRFEWALRSRADWAFVDDGWFDEISDEYARELSAAGQAIETYLSPHEPKEIATRWLDALHWYGQAISERFPSAQIVKHVAALERLSITNETRTDGDRGLTDAVSRRAALFATYGHVEALTKARAEVRDLYRWRSDLMHGRSSPVTKQQLRGKELRSVVYRAEEVTRQALFGALAVYANLILDDKPKDKHLEKRLRDLEMEFGLGDGPSGLRGIVPSMRRWIER